MVCGWCVRPLGEDFGEAMRSDRRDDVRVIWLGFCLPPVASTPVAAGRRVPHRVHICLDVLFNRTRLRLESGSNESARAGIAREPAGANRRFPIFGRFCRDLKRIAANAASACPSVCSASAFRFFHPTLSPESSRSLRCRTRGPRRAVWEGREPRVARPNIPRADRAGLGSRNRQGLLFFFYS